MERGAGLPGQGPAQRSGGAPVHAPVPDSKAGARPSKLDGPGINLNRDSMASTAVSDGSLRGGTSYGTSVGGTPVNLLRLSSGAARRPVESGEWIKRSRSWNRRDGASSAPSTGAGDAVLPAHVILPNERAYLYWFLVTLVASLWTGMFEPYVIAFQAQPGLYPYRDGQAIMYYVLLLLFAADMAVRFRLAYYDNAGLVTSSRAIADRYMRTYFVIDLLALIPFDWIACAVVAPHGGDSMLARYLTLLGLLRLLRLYRVGVLLSYLGVNLSVSLAIVTITRNFMMVFYVAHWAACGFYFTARVHGLGTGTWIGINPAALAAMNTSTRYIQSYYWAITTFATVGYGDWHPVSTAECVFAILFIMINIALAAFIVGTTTLLVVRRDTQTSQYRDQAASLRTYSQVNGLPPALTRSMHEHLRLSFANSDIADEAVLSTYPTTLRRRALRHLYLSTVRRCYLFAGARQRFIDALLSAASVELLMPGIDVISDGDHVNELYLCVAGALEVTLPGALEAAENLPLSGERSVRLGVRRQLGEGDTVGEIAFFTEVPQCGTVRTLSVARVLHIPRERYSKIAEDFPLGTRAVLDNLRSRAQELVDAEFRGDAGRALLASAPAGVAFSQASTELGGSGRAGGSGGAARSAMTAVQERVLADMLRVRALAASTLARSDERRTLEFLSAASRGDISTLRVMIQQGFNANAADYDGRTALMLAAAKGQTDAVAVLLSAQVNASACDNLGGSAIMEACRHGHDAILKQLVAHGARWHLSTVATASELCTCVFECNLPLMRRFLAAGARADAGDYDKRTALHIACAENSPASVKLLVEAGADVNVMDRWGSGPLDEAVRVGARSVIEFLLKHNAPTYKVEERAGEFLSAAARGDCDKLRHMLQHGVDVDSQDYDKRSALMLAAAAGHARAVNTLLGANASTGLQDNFGGSALTEAIKARRSDLVGLLAQNGATLGWPEERVASELCNVVAAGDCEKLALYIQAGANVDSADYDKRVALHIASAEGKLEMINALIAAKADINFKDRWGAAAMDEAVKHGHEAVIGVLRAAGGALGKEPARLAGALCSLVYAGDTAAIKLYVMAGAPLDAADYDKRVALHIAARMCLPGAAAEGKLDMVRVLAEGGADLDFADRWGATPLQEAAEHGHGEIVDALRAAGATLSPDTARIAGLLCSLVYKRDATGLQIYLRAGADPNVGDYDARRPLHIAAAEGAVAEIEILLAAGADPAVLDRWGATPLDEAKREKRARTVTLLQAAMKGG